MGAPREPRQASAVRWKLPMAQRELAAAFGNGSWREGSLQRDAAGFRRGKSSLQGRDGSSQCATASFRRPIEAPNGAMEATNGSMEAYADTRQR